MDDPRQLLELLHRGGRVNYFWSSADKHSAWYEGDPVTLPTGPDTYMNVHPCISIPTRGDPVFLRGKVDEVAAVGCLFAEFDAKDFAGSMNATMTHITNLDLAPTAIVNSGHGYHCYWILKEALILGDEKTRKVAADRQAAWVAFVGADSGAKDLARVLRVPGTTNAKKNPVPVTLDRLTDDEYALEEFDRLLADISIATVLLPRAARDHSPIREGERHQTLVSLGGTLRKRGMSPESIEAALLAENATRCQPPMSEDEVRKIADAIGKYDPGKPKKSVLEVVRATDLMSMEFQDPNWVIPNFLPAGLTILAGRPKIGKSWLVLQMACAIGAGASVLEMDTDRRPVLYLALEDDLRRLQRRIVMQGWKDLDDVYLFPKSRFVDEYGPLQTTGGDALGEWMRQVRPAIVAIDTLSRICSGDQMDVARMTAALDPLHQLALDHKCAVLLVDHHRKGILETPDSIGDILGSVAKGAVADNSIGLYRERGKADAQLVLVGRDMPDAAHALRFDEVHGLWQLTGPGDRFGDSDLDKALLAAVEMLSPASLVEVAREVDRNKGTVYARLQDLANFGRIHREGQGRGMRYTLVEDPL